MGATSYLCKVNAMGGWKSLASDIQKFNEDISCLISERYSKSELSGGGKESADTALLCAVAPR